MKPAILLLAAIACFLEIPKEEKEVATEHDSDLETQIQILESPFGEMPAVRERQRAAEWLLAHADRAYPRLLAMIRDKSAGLAVIELIPEFKRAESIAPLESLLGLPERTAWAAGQALARQSGPDALAALLRGVRRPEPDAVIAAADGLATLGDKAVCSDLQATLEGSSERTRYHIVRAAAALKCLTRTRLQEFALGDSSAEIRALAADFLARN